VNTTTKVSVIIPNYNHSHFLKQRIGSVLNQTCQDFEIIILDDCSTDNSVQVIEEYRHHPKISAIVINTENSGSTFLQWRKGIEMARGEWIWIAESDDWCEKTFLETLLEYTDESAVISSCQSITVSHDGSILWQTNSDKLIDKLDGKAFFKKHWTSNLIPNASMAIFRRKAYDEIEKYFLKYRHIGDFVFWCELSLKGNALVSGKKLNYFRKHPLDVQTKAIVSGAWHYEKLELIEEFFSLGVINEEVKRKTFSDSYKQYLLSGQSIAKEHRRSLVKKYYSKLGGKLYLILTKYLCFSLLKKIASSLRNYLNT